MKSYQEPEDKTTASDEVKSLEQMYALYMERYGEEDKSTLMLMSMLAKAYDDDAQYEKALELYEKHYAITCKLYGEEHPDTVRSLAALTSARIPFVDQKESLEQHKALYELQCKVFGKDEPETFATKSIIGFIENMLALMGEE